MITCSHPNLCYRYRNLRDKWHFIGGYKGNFHDGHIWHPRFGRLNINPESGEVYDADAYMFRLVPCGTCSLCLKRRAREWRNRCIAEMQSHPPDSCWFLTLTYDPQHVPLALTPLGEVVQTLRKQDLILWQKRFRKLLDTKFGVRYRFYAAGEYGTMSKRPHYHEIIFGVPRDVLKPAYLRASPKGNGYYYTSDLITKTWPDGYHIITPATPATMAYVAMYCTKKLGHNSADYEKLGVEPEFTLMSRQPALGDEYFSKIAQDAFKNGGRCYVPDMSSERGVTDLVLPKTFRRKYWRDDEMREFSRKALTKDLSDAMILTEDTRAFEERLPPDTRLNEKASRGSL